MQLVDAFTYRVKTTGPLKTTKGSPAGERLYWTVSEAELVGTDIKAKLAAPGSDWMWVHEDGFWRPDVRAPFVTEDGETILMHYTGLVQQTDAFKKAAEANKPTDWADQYMRLMIHLMQGRTNIAGSIRHCSSPKAACLALDTSNMPCRV